MRRPSALLFTFALLASACGGGGGDSADATTTTTATDSTEAGVAATDASTSTTADTSDAPAAAGDWCAGAARVQQRIDELQAAGTPLQDRLRIQFEELLDTQLGLLRSAPSRIEADALRYADALEQAAAELAEVEYNFFAIEEGSIPLFDDPAVQASSDVVTDYLETACELDTDGGDSGASLRLTDDEIDALLGGEDRDEVLGALLALGLDEAEAECVMRESLSQGVDVLGDADDELIALLEGCGVSANKLAAIGLGVDEGDVASQLQALTSLFTPELQLAMQLSSEVRDGVVVLFVDQGLSRPQAECAVQTLTDLEDLEVLNDTDRLLELMFDCGITLEDLATLG